MGTLGHSRTEPRFVPWACHAVAPFLVSMMLTACGGGANSPSSSSSSSSIASVTPACAPAAVATNATAQCTVAVKGSGSYSSAVLWSASSGTVSSSGVFTAPATAGSATVTATSTQDPSKSGTHLRHRAAGILHRHFGPGRVQSVGRQRQCDLAMRGHGQGHRQFQLRGHVVCHARERSARPACSPRPAQPAPPP